MQDARLRRTWLWRSSALVMEVSRITLLHITLNGFFRQLDACGTTTGQELDI